MIKDQKNLPHSRLHLTITASVAQFRHAFDHELEKLAKDAHIEGFRPGKAPAAQVLQKIGRQRVEVEALDHAVSDAYYEALQEAKRVPVDNPNIEITAFTAPGDSAKDDEVAITFTAEVDVVPDVEIKGYQKIKVKKPVLKEVTEKDVDEVIEELRRQRAALEPAKDDAKVTDGIWADIHFKGSVDGVAREDMASSAHPIILGRGQLIPGFEEALIGLKVGEAKTFPITFPKDYHATELAGKKAEFTAGINELKNLVLPDLDDKFAVSYGKKTMEELRKMVKENLESERQEAQATELEESVLAELLKVAKFETPQSLIRQETERVLNDNRERFNRMPGGWDHYLQQVGKTEAEIRADIEPQSEKNVRIGLALGKVIAEEKIDAKSEKVMREAMDKLIEIATR